MANKPITLEEMKAYVNATWEKCKAEAWQEPVAWMWADGTITTDPDRADGTWTPLYTALRQWQGLADEEIWSDGSTMDLSEDGIRKFARAIELKLKEKNNG